MCMYSPEACKKAAELINELLRINGYATEQPKDPISGAEVSVTVEDSDDDDDADAKVRYLLTDDMLVSLILVLLLQYYIILYTILYYTILYLSHNNYYYIICDSTVVALYCIPL